MDIILGSSSPRRKNLLTDLNIQFRICSPDIDETRLRGEAVLCFVQRVARQKAEQVALETGYLKEIPESRGRVAAQVYCKKNFAGFQNKLDKFTNCKEDWAILTADTIVLYGKAVLGKPTSKEEALSMLRRLSGKTHEVMTAFCWFGSIKQKPRMYLGVEKTKVTFAKKDKHFWQRYVSTGEPMDKAGAYAAQGFGMCFIEHINGSYSNVVGLPVTSVVSSFSKIFGLELCEFSKSSSDNSKKN